MNKSRSLSVAFEVFRLLLTYADVIMSAPSQTYKVSMSGEAGRHRRLRLDRRQKQALAHLRRKKWIDYSLDDGVLTFSFTKVGLHQALVDRIIATERVLPRGQVCIVAYDVPEHILGGRRVLGMLLRKSGFTRLQKSVWMTNRDVVADLATTIRLHRMQKIVTILVGKKIV